MAKMLSMKLDCAARKAIAPIEVFTIYSVAARAEHCEQSAVSTRIRDDLDHGHHCFDGRDAFYNAQPDVISQRRRSFDC